MGRPPSPNRKTNAEYQNAFRERQRQEQERLERIAKNASLYLHLQGQLFESVDDLDALDQRLQELVNEGRFL